MCTDLKYLGGYPSRAVACGKCDECISQKRMDFVGRCIGESEYALASYFVTLTYDDKLAGVSKGNNVSALVFDYEHIKLYLKRLRNAGYQVRYHVVGEFGSERGRVHWHALLWFQNRDPMRHFDRKRFEGPPLRLNWSCLQEFWPHGFSEYKESNPGRIAYLAGYIIGGQSSAAKRQKAPKRECDRVVSQGSKVPLVGGRFFREYARRHVEQGLAPQNHSYSFDSSRKADGRMFEYWMGPTAKEYYCKCYNEFWEARHGDAHKPVSDMLAEYEDIAMRRGLRGRGLSDEELEAEMLRLRSLRVVDLRQRVDRPDICPRTGRAYGPGDTRAPIRWDGALLVWRYPPKPEAGVQTLYWSFDDDGRQGWFPVIRDGKHAWQRHLEVEKRLREERGR